MTQEGVLTAQEAADKENPSIETISLRAEVDRLKLDIKQIKKIAGDTTRFYDRIIEATTPVSPLPQVYSTKVNKNKSVLSALLHITDWHTDEIINPTEVDGFNAYNPDIQKQLLKVLLEKVIDYITLNRNLYVIDELVIVCTGDLISGDIHYELVATNADPVPVQVIHAAEHLAVLVGGLAPHFKKIRVEYIVPDNHSRRTQKFQFKQAAKNSDNYIVGYITKLFMSKHDNVEVNLHESLWKVVEVNGTQYLCSHGHTVRGWAGFPYYGIDRAVGKESKKRMNAPDNKKFDKILIGHYHAPCKMQDWIIGGSLSGTTEFDHGQGRHAQPMQTAWLVHKRYGEFNFTEFKPAL